MKNKLSKQKSIHLDCDKIIDLYKKSESLPLKEGKKLRDFLRSGAVIPIKDGKIAKVQLESLMEHIVQGIVEELDKSKKKKSSKKSDSKKPEPKPKDKSDVKGGAIQFNPTGTPPERINRQNYTSSWNLPQDPHEKWVEDMANKLWKDPQEIGQGRYKWRVDQAKEPSPGTKVYLVSKSKQVKLTRVFANRNGEWFYFNPDAKGEERKWTPVGSSPPEGQPSMEKEQSGTAAAAPVTGPTAFKKKKPMEEMTTTSGGGGSSAGTPGYNIPGAFADEGGSKAGVQGSAALGYTLTPIGKQDMKRKADKLYEGAELGGDFNSAQRSYDRQEPKEAPEVQCPHCGSQAHYIENWHKGRYFLWTAQCDECGATFGDNNVDDDRGDN